VQYYFFFKSCQLIEIVYSIHCLLKPLFDILMHIKIRLEYFTHASLGYRVLVFVLNIFIAFLTLDNYQMIS
ncbi:MAG TPA: hypothetical protein VN704_08895, partial [Verrucomicrobiae bacterium]|nr:hypothetical protein [Verrucomicrobiae bacterium]